MRLWSLSARMIARASNGARTRAARWSRLRSNPWPFFTARVGLYLGTVPHQFGHGQTKPHCHVVQGHRSVLNNVVQQPGDHDVFVKPGANEDQCHRRDVLEIGSLAATACLSVVRLSPPSASPVQSALSSSRSFAWSPQTAPDSPNGSIRPLTYHDRCLVRIAPPSDTKPLIGLRRGRAYRLRGRSPGIVRGGSRRDASIATKLEMVALDHVRARNGRER